MTIAQRLLVPLYHGNSDKTSPFDKACPILSFPPEKPRILAFSARIDRTQQRIFDLRDLDRKLCEDRKNPLDHVKPANLAKSVSKRSRSTIFVSANIVCPSVLTTLFLFLAIIIRPFESWSRKEVSSFPTTPMTNYSMIWPATSWWLLVR